MDGIKFRQLKRPKSSFENKIVAKNVTKIVLGHFDLTQVDHISDNNRSKQICVDFTSGNCRTRTYLAKMPANVKMNTGDSDDTTWIAPMMMCDIGDDEVDPYEEDTISYGEAVIMLDEFLSANRETRQTFLLEHLLSYLWWLILHKDEKYIHDAFKQYRTKFKMQYGSEHIGLLDEFLVYLVTIRKNMGGLSPFEDFDLIMKQFKKYHKRTTKGEYEWLKTFVKNNFFTTEATESTHILSKRIISKEFISEVYAVQAPLRKPEYDTLYSDIVDAIYNKTRKVEIGNLPYDGALIVTPNPGINQCVLFMDVASEYPSAILAANMGSGMCLTPEEIAEYGDQLEEGRDYRWFTTKRSDDFKTFSDFDAEFKEALVNNCYAIVTTKVTESAICKAVNRVMQDRFKDKKKSEDYYEQYETCVDPAEKARLKTLYKLYEDMSTSKKISLNALYGNIQYMMLGGFRGIVTAIGRQTTSSMIAQCYENFGKESCLIVYGDTDSVALRFLIDTDTLLTGEPEMVAETINPKRRGRRRHAQ